MRAGARAPRRFGGPLALALTAMACAGAGGAPPDGGRGPARVVPAQGAPAPAVGAAFVLPREAPVMGRETALQLSLSAAVDLPRVRVAVRLPPEVRLIGGGLSWEGPLPAGAPRVLPLRIVVARSGDFTLGATAEILEGAYAGQVAGAVVYVRASPSGILWSLDPL